MPRDVEKHMLAGGIAAAVSSVALYPLDLIKVRFQVYDGVGSRYNSLFSAFRTILQEEGVKGLYKGISPGLTASVLSWGGYFYFYEYAKQRKLGAEAISRGEKLETIDHLLAGIEAGAVMVCVTNPIWLVKTRMQLQVDGDGLSRHYRGLGDALKTIMKEEGVLGLYRGFVPALFLTSHGAIQFAFYEKAKILFQSFSGRNEKQQPAWFSMSLGGFSKMVAATATYPYQVVKSRLQQRDIEIVNNQTGHVERFSKYKGVIDCIIKMWKHEGVLSFFKGIVPNCLRVAPASAITFLVYEETLKIIGR